MTATDQSPGLTAANADLIIRPKAGSLLPDWRVLWASRSILLTLTRREILKFSQRSDFGVLWFLVRPLAMLVIFVSFRAGSGANVFVDMPYPVFLFAGFILWFIFTDAVMAVAGSARSNAGLIRKIFFPRLYSPIATVVAQFYPLWVGMLALTAVMIWYGVHPGPAIVMLPIVLLHAVLLSFAIGMVFSVFSIEKQDWEKLLGILLYIGMFVSPIIYSARLIPERYQFVYQLNPVVGLVDGFRASLVSLEPFPWEAWGYSFCFTVVAALLAVIAFQKAEARLLDEL